MTQKWGSQKYHILTYGCQMNVRDSETIAGFLEFMGYEEAPLEEAGLVVMNTCSVRHSAENKVYGKLGQLARFKKTRPEMVIAFGGCMAQLPEVRSRLDRLGIDLIFGTHNIHEFPEMLRQVVEGSGPIRNVWDHSGPVVEIEPELNRRKGGVTAFVNIMYGCNNFCSYCIVPYTRGRERSRRPQDILKEIIALAELGYKEITLLGQNVNSYGRGLDETIDFAGLLRLLHEKEPRIVRFRFTTCHPKDVSDKLIIAIADLPGVCEHIHVAMQSGSDSILKAMNRGYTREHYLNLARRLYDGVPGIAISTDIIVGFPGETEEDFEDTLDMVRQVSFDSAFTFMYSPRSGTKAALLPEALDYATKNARLLRLNDIQYQIALEKNQALCGRTMEVLVEGPSKNNPHILSSRTRCNRIVLFNGPDSLIGSLVDVRINEARTFTLKGELKEPARTAHATSHI